MNVLWCLCLVAGCILSLFAVDANAVTPKKPVRAAKPAPSQGVVLQMNDGTRLVVTPGWKWTANLRTVFGPANIPLSRIRRIERRGKQRFVVHLKNGDRITGQLLVRTIDIPTRYGILTVPTGSVVSIATDASERRKTARTDFERLTKKSLTDDGVTVAVVCFAPMSLQWDYVDVDKTIRRYVSYRMQQDKVKVINPDRVQRWLEVNPTWESAAEIGGHFKTSYVVDIDLKDFSLWEKSSASLHRGRAEAVVSVWEMGKDGKGSIIYRTMIKSIWHLEGPRKTSDITYSRFRLMYIQFLTKQIAGLLCDSGGE